MLNVQRALAMALALAVLAPTPAPNGDLKTPLPLDEKEVVRLFVAGTPTEEILREIASREPKFDLSPEMLGELRLAGLPPALIEAMRQRQPAPVKTEVSAQPSPTPEPITKVLLSIHLKKGAQSTTVPVEIDAALAKAWDLTRPEDRRIEGFAVYAACLSSTHVPDHWRNQSPLGRDFRSMPRHELLTLLALRTEATNKGEGLRVDWPERVEVPLDAGMAHDLSLGLAVGVAGRYFRLTAVEWPDFKPSAEPMDLAVTVSQRDGLAGFEVHWTPAAP